MALSRRGRVAELLLIHPAAPPRQAQCRLSHEDNFSTANFTPLSFNFVLALAACASAGQSSPSHQIRDLIQPIVLTAGVADTLFVRDLFYAEDDALNFHSHDHLSGCQIWSLDY